MFKAKISFVSAYGVFYKVWQEIDKEKYDLLHATDKRKFYAPGEQITFTDSYIRNSKNLK